jgi:hypothetical protein
MLATIRNRLSAVSRDSPTGRGQQSGITQQKIVTPSGRNDESASKQRADRNAKEYRIPGLVAQLENQCLLCHYREDLVARPGAQLIPTRWLQGGRFNHQSHTDVSCQLCHPQTNPKDKDALRVALESGMDDSKVIMISGIETCIHCHRDPELPVSADFSTVKPLLGRMPNIAPEHCTYCHSYHEPDATAVKAR